MMGWSVVVPVKGWGDAKSRLSQLARSERQDLARALAVDTISVVLATPGVAECLVVGESSTCRDLAWTGARTVVCPDDVGLIGALRAGTDAAHRESCGVALLVADLPMLSAAALDEALELVPAVGSGVVLDRAGTGTVMLASRDGSLTPAFGPGSARQHVATGATDLSDLVDPALRHDLDTWEDLGATQWRPGSLSSTWYRRTCLGGAAEDDSGEHGRAWVSGPITETASGSQRSPRPRATCAGEARSTTRVVPVADLQRDGRAGPAAIECVSRPSRLVVERAGFPSMGSPVPTARGRTEETSPWRN